MARALAVAVFIACCGIYGYAQFSNSFAGPYELRIKQIARCDDPGLNLIQFDQTKIVKYNRTTYLYSSNFSLPYGFTDEVKLGMSAYVHGNGGWKVLQKDVTIGPACSTVKKLSPKLVESVARAIGTYPKPCPNPPGNYSVTELPLNMELEIPILPYNKYMIDFWMLHKGKKLGCGRMFVDIVPKEDRKRKGNGKNSG